MPWLVCYLTTGNISRERAWDYAELEDLPVK